jgi:hypothetical protein
MSVPRIVGSAIRILGPAIQTSAKPTRIQRQLSHLGQASLDQRSDNVAHMGLRGSSDAREQFVMSEGCNPICH